MNETNKTSMNRPFDGRVSCGENCTQDASRWVTHITWTEALKLAPVYGYLILIADRSGFVNILDLRHPGGEKPGDVSDEEKWMRTKEALSRHHAKWWSYLPLSPPINVDAVAWEFDEDKKPIIIEAKDPPKCEWKLVYNIPHEIVK